MINHSPNPNTLSIQEVNDLIDSLKNSEISEQNQSILLSIAQNPDTEPELLEKITSQIQSIYFIEEKTYHLEILQAITSNPNTPPEILFKLGGIFPDEMLANPVFDLLSMDLPNLILELPLNELVNRITLPDFILHSISFHPARRKFIKEFTTDI